MRWGRAACVAGMACAPAPEVARAPEVASPVEQEEDARAPEVASPVEQEEDARAPEVASLVEQEEDARAPEVASLVEQEEEARAPEVASPVVQEEDARAPEVASLVEQEDVPLPDVGSSAARGRLDPALVPELPQVWGAPEVQLEAAAVDGGAGVVGRWSQFPETIVRLDARTGAVQWRAAQPGEVMWFHVAAGTEVAAIAGRLPARGGERWGLVDLRDGRLRWHRARPDRSTPAIGRDGTGVGLYTSDCELRVVDAADGQALATLRGRTMGIGHSGPDGPGVDEVCATPPVLIGQTGACTIAAVPEGVADHTITAVQSGGSCWSVGLGRVDDRPAIDAASGVIRWHAHATLHVARLDRTRGRLVWRREFAGPQCYPTAHMAPDGAGGQLVVVHACGSAVALAATDGAERWRQAVQADAVVVAGEADDEPRLHDSPGLRVVQLLDPGGAPGGRVEVPDRASAHAVAAGVVVDADASLALWDAQGRQRWAYEVSGARWSALGEWLFVQVGSSTVIVEQATGRMVGRDPYAARPLAITTTAAGTRLVVLRAGYVWGRPLP